MAGSGDGRQHRQRLGGVIGPALPQAEFAGSITQKLEDPGTCKGGKGPGKNQQRGTPRRDDAQHDIMVPALPLSLQNI